MFTHHGTAVVPHGPLKRMSSEFLRTAKKIGNGSLPFGKKGCEFSVIAASRVITSRRTVTDCAKTIKERDSGLEISERPTCMYDGRQQDARLIFCINGLVLLTLDGAMYE